MARYTTSVRSPLDPEEAFAYMADLRNLAIWDPGVRRVVQVVGEGPGPDAVFEVTVAGVGRDLTLRYETVEYDAPGWFVVRAVTSQLQSEDRVSVAPVPGGCVVTYDAELRLRGLFGLADPALALAFRRIGDRAKDGLVRALEGTPVA
ncbi:MAG: SRPBCC family protein [Acidimicrobiales bacterium]|jgi:hypothetical protein|nr:SRPBCC family protein [Acidimicrobiales bacterium]